MKNLKLGIDWPNNDDNEYLCGVTRILRPLVGVVGRVALPYHRTLLNTKISRI